MRVLSAFGSQWAAHVVLVAGVYGVIVAVALVIEAAVYRRRAEAMVAELLRLVAARRPSLEGEADPSSPNSCQGRGRNFLGESGMRNEKKPRSRPRRQPLDALPAEGHRT